MNNARVVQEGVSVLGLAPSLEERNVEVAQRARLLRVSLLAAQCGVGRIWMDPFRARASIRGDEAEWDLILVPVRARVVIEALEANRDACRLGQPSECTHQLLNVTYELLSHLIAQCTPFL